MKLRRLPSPIVSGIILIAICTLLFLLQSCKKSRSDYGALLAKETGNKVFKEIDPEMFATTLQKAISKNKKLRNPAFTSALYAAQNYEPVLVMKFLADSGLFEAAEKVSQAQVHGLDPEIFKVKQLQELLGKIYDKKSIANVDEACNLLADLELASSATLTDYANALQFGIISPRKIYAQYYTATKRPDSVSFAKVYQTSSIQKFIDSIQPKDKAYQIMQQALAQKLTAPGLSVEETQRILAVNLERMRWQNKPKAEKYVWVNIPDFTLQVMNQGKASLSMKVCVGEGRNKNQAPSLIEYDENDLKKDRPFNRETPQLTSEIHSVQVNPVWNIPESIAKNEISKYAAKDRYYLENNNIDVFHKGKKVDDPETIDWTQADVGTTYTFKQRPGDDNALGKIKFLFNNQSSVYLHDTPAKAAFSLPVRAVSHGCVRVEDPLGLANALFGNGGKFEKIKTEMSSTDPKAENIALDQKIPVVLTYQTCWEDPAGGQLKFAKDVYGLDAVLFTYLNRL